jgi:hypothetical protein
MNEKHIIIWQKWLDPFGEDTEDQENNDNINESDDTIDDDYYNGDSDFFKEEETKSKYEKIKMTKVIATPMGIIPIDENTASGKIFNFWIGHTNFNITKFISSIIEKTPGVECLDIFTRYRFRVAIGKAFNSSSVMKNIQDSVYQHVSNKE